MNDKTTISYGNNDETTGNYKVVFLNQSGISLVRGFDSAYIAEKFVNKLRHSKRCQLLSYTHY